MAEGYPCRRKITRRITVVSPEKRYYKIAFGNPVDFAAGAEHQTGHYRYIRIYLPEYGYPLCFVSAGIALIFDFDGKTPAIPFKNEINLHSLRGSTPT